MTRKQALVLYERLLRDVRRIQSTLDHAACVESDSMDGPVQDFEEPPSLRDDTRDTATWLEDRVRTRIRQKGERRA